MKAVINTIKECHAKGQPVLVGTTSIVQSEEVSAQLKRQGIDHKVLNAKYVVFYEFSANKIKDSTSNKRYYIYGSKYIYDINGNLIRGFSATSDTKEMTVLQSVLYLECQFK